MKTVKDNVSIMPKLLNRPRTVPYHFKFRTNIMNTVGLDLRTNRPACPHNETWLLHWTRHPANIENKINLLIYCSQWTIRNIYLYYYSSISRHHTEINENWHIALYHPLVVMKLQKIKRNLKFEDLNFLVTSIGLLNQYKI